MSSKLDTLDMVIYGAGLLLFIGLMASVILSVIDNPPVANEVANEVANGVANNTAITTETEVYKVVCTSDGEGYCKEYSVRRITKE
jgi:hypothetical protein